MLLQYEKAINSYQLALKLNPDSAECHFNLASTYNDKGDEEPALAHFLQARAFDESNIEIHLNLGSLYEKRQMYNDSLESFKAALNLDEKNEKAKDGQKRMNNILE